MLKKRVLKRLLPLLFSFCFVFSGFLSINVFAYSGDNITSTPVVWGGNASAAAYYGVGNGVSLGSVSVSGNNGFYFKNGSLNNISFIEIANYTTTQQFIYDTQLYDYYFISSVSCYVKDSNLFNFRPDVVQLGFYENAPNYVWNYVDLENVITFDHNNGTVCGFSYVGKIPLLDNNVISSIKLIDNTTGSLGNGFTVEMVILAVDKNNQNAVGDIVTAINNQTGALQGSIGQAADVIQQSIEDQYSGDPETEFSVDDVISQHNEKMGVLSFGSDVMLQFLDMFQSANVGTAELTLPGFNITVENVEYSVWPDYSFNFEQLNEWVPALMSVIRVMLPAFVWLMVLRYCIKVFEDNFLSK